MKTEFNLGDLSSLTSSVSVTEFNMVSPRVARVIAKVVVGDDRNRNDITARLTASMQDRAAPIANSYSWLDKSHRSVIGFVAAQRDTREASSASAYSVVATNMYMDPKDETLWEMKEGAAGKYLARQDHDDLASLIESVRSSPTGSTPRMASVISASASKKEFLAFVHDSGYAAPTVEYGFCVARGKDSATVVAQCASKPIVVLDSMVVSSHQVDTNSLHAAISRSGKASVTASMSMEEYYSLAYSYAPEYVELIISQINEQRAA